ncbi:type III-B CRISPR module-associated Cmr3 family protein [Methylomusa anaerophila]|uniref:CRISPR-associated protein n=1 Tax=Methylomusa anaerophila TaxID=1930071 RepID=A0A348AQY8_9FIRM|nr:type III-B CRISPR module-associated Cmr3 family protein [Methylomusa anaerophila]BBB93486.1 CRISPR-associated protein [Methylomusa anaerophila]
MSKLSLVPADSFFFKGHLTTELGTPSHLVGLFPPRPNTVYGALRAAYIHRHSTFAEFRRGKGGPVKQWMGTPASYGAFRQRAILLAKNRDYLLPLPLDYNFYRLKNSDAGTWRALPLHLEPNSSASSAGVSWTLGLPDREKTAGKTASPGGRYLRLEDWKAGVLQQQSFSAILSLEDDIINDYAKTGIAIGRDSRTAERSYFYQMNMMNLKADCALVALSEPCPDFSEVPLVSLGGENRPWFLSQETNDWKLWSEEQLEEIKSQLQRTPIARIILLTPALWPNNLSFLLDLQTEGEIWQLTPDIEVEPITWATARPELYGGWDIVRHRPKPRQWMMPAGTVIYVKIRENDISPILALADGFTLFADQEECSGMEGFGFAVIAGIKESNQY